MEITLSDILAAQERQAKFVDPDKNCSTCKHENTLEIEAPCNNCINSFIGIPFNPTSWEAKSEAAK